MLDLPDTAGTPQLMVGWEWMRRFAVRVDPEHNQLTLQDGPKFRYTGGGPPIPLILNQHGNGAEIEARIEGVPGRFTLDTGNQMGTFVNASFVEEHKLVAMTGATYRGYNGRGFGGDSPEAWIARAKTFSIGDVVLHGAIVRLQTGADAMYSNAGNIGQDILNRFVLVLDTLHSTMYLEKTRHWDEREAFNRTGILHDPNDGVDHIKTVLPGGSGEAAGLKVGDDILAIDGKPPSDDPNDPVFTQPAGTVLHLRIRRGGAEQVVPVTLRDVL